ncbi:hypothetical protein ACFFGH_21020 [Lysobacter korlensis]|uniref:Roadblock/LAMTOR2 domain-containing protein n=1 Tax=Lysobacter korlensis TaxID=553636 RepID=A0ABV6RTN0_9GAMM
MVNAAEWKKHFKQRIGSTDRHLLLTHDGGPYLGLSQSLVGFLAEICPRGSLELVEERLKNTVMTVTDSIAPPPGQPAGSREIPTDPLAVRETVERANQWLQDVYAGMPAGGREGVRFVQEEKTGGLLRAGNLVSAGLVWLAPPGAVEGLHLALQRRPMQSNLIQDLRFVLQMVMRDAAALRPLF